MLEAAIKNKLFLYSLENWKKTDSYSRAENYKKVLEQFVSPEIKYQGVMGYPRMDSGISLRMLSWSEKGKFEHELE